MSISNFATLGQLLCGGGSWGPATSPSLFSVFPVCHLCVYHLIAPFGELRLGVLRYHASQKRRTVSAKLCWKSPPFDKEKMGFLMLKRVPLCCPSRRERVIAMLGYSFFGNDKLFNV